MVIDISVAVIAAAFLILVIFTVVFILKLRTTLHEVDRTLIKARKHLDEIAPPTAKILEHTNQVSYDIKRKMDALDPFFNAFSNIGQYLEEKTMSLGGSVSAKKNLSDEEIVSDEMKPEAEKVRASDVYDFIDTGLRLWQKIKKRRKP